MKTTTFSRLDAEATYRLSVPLVTMAVGMAGQSCIYGEYSILISSRRPKYFQQRTVLKSEQVPADIFPFDFHAMKREIEQQVQTRLSLYYFDLSREAKIDVCLRNFELEDGDKTDIVRLWLRGEFANEIGAMRKETYHAAGYRRHVGAVRLQ